MLRKQISKFSLTTIMPNLEQRSFAAVEKGPRLGNMAEKSELSCPSPRGQRNEDPLFGTFQTVFYRDGSLEGVNLRAVSWHRALFWG